MYSTLRRFEEQKLKQNIGRVLYAPLLNEINLTREKSLRSLQSFERGGIPFCRHNDDLVTKIEFEIGLKK